MANAPGLPFQEWWIRMDNPGNGDRTNTCRMIHTVPELFRQKESCKGCFDPMVVSIGPYHHGKKELQEVEGLKDSMALEFIKDCEMQFSAVYAEVKRISDDARRRYPDEERVSRFDESQFTRLMLVDGCFVLQFINSFMNNNHTVEHMKNNIAAFVRRDLMLLENQLPYIVLETLMRIRKNLEDDLIDKFISSFRGDLSTQTTFRVIDKRSLFGIGYHLYRPPLHLLDIFLSRYINEQDLNRQSSTEKHSHCYSYPTAKELMTTGFLFRPSKSEHFTDIVYMFAPAGLYLPKIMIEATTKSMLLNLVAYETSPDAPDDLCGLTSYICFMDSLIDHAEDVKVLRSRGIVIDLLGSDQQAAKLFNDIARDLVPNSYTFGFTRQFIEDNFRSRTRAWMAEFITTHFSSPWTLIAFTAVTATIVMTFLQAFFTVKGYYSGKGR